MVKSMTGFGRGVVTDQDVLYHVELKSVNNRYCDVAAHIPRSILSLEERIKREVRKYISRGRVDIFVKIKGEKTGSIKINADIKLAAAYTKALKKLDELDIKNDISTSLLSRFPDIIVIEEEEDIEGIWQNLRGALEKALIYLNTSREEEGNRLAADIKKRLGIIGALVLEVESLSGSLLDDYRQRLKTRMEELLEKGEVDENRLLTEVAIFAERSSITEEIVRLKSHTQAFTRSIEEKESIGRKMDFILQEMNRETNTIASKANSYEISKRSVDIKSEIEKIREQVQNIE